MSTAVVTLVTSRENKDDFGESEDGGREYRNALKTLFVRQERTESFSYVTSVPQAIRWETWGMGTGRETGMPHLHTPVQRSVDSSALPDRSSHDC